MRRVLIVLQNPYARGGLAGCSQCRFSVWQREFRQSRSGRRLSPILAVDGYVTRFTNANPTIAQHVNVCLSADLGHLRRRLGRVRPDVVVACGRVAQAALTGIWKGHLLCIPHPAYRLLTNRLILVCRKLLLTLEHNGRPIRVALKQGRGKICKLRLEGGDE